MTSTWHLSLQEVENQEDMHGDKTWKADNERGMLRFMSEYMHSGPATKCTADDSGDPEPSFTDTPRMHPCSSFIDSHPAEQQDIDNQQIQTN